MKNIKRAKSEEKTFEFEPGADRGREGNVACFARLKGLRWQGCTVLGISQGKVYI